MYVIILVLPVIRPNLEFRISYRYRIFPSLRSLCVAVCACDKA